jgi:hypothetical protein
MQTIISIKKTRKEYSIKGKKNYKKTNKIFTIITIRNSLSTRKINLIRIELPIKKIILLISNLTSRK